jgi:hypothetical protein
VAGHEFRAKIFLGIWRVASGQPCRNGTVLAKHSGLFIAPRLELDGACTDISSAKSGTAQAQALHPRNSKTRCAGA